MRDEELSQIIQQAKEQVRSSEEQDQIINLSNQQGETEECKTEDKSDSISP